MLFVSDMALRKVRNNIDHLFDKNLTDLIRGIRNNKKNEVIFIIIANEIIANIFFVCRLVILLLALKKLS